MIEQDYAGKVEVSTLVINNKENYVDATKYVVGFSIFEDVYSPFVYIELAVADFDGLNKKFPLLGEEFLTVSFKTSRSKEVNYIFLLYKSDQSSVFKMNNAQAYILRGITLEKSFDFTKTVSEAYRGTPTEIADSLFNTYISKDTNKTLKYEQSKGVTKIVFPEVSPLRAIDYCKKKAIPNSAAASPFMFFQNSEGYNFVSLNTLYNSGIANRDPYKHVLATGQNNPLNIYEQSVGGEEFKSDVISFQMQSNYDTISKIDFGAFNNATYSFDLTTKQYVFRKQFNLSQNFNKFTLGSSGETNTKQFMQTFNDKELQKQNIITDFSLQLEGAQHDFFPDVVGEVIAYSNIVAEQNAKILMYGDSNITAGQVLYFQTFAADDSNERRKVDPQKTGNYLLSAVRHDIILDSQTSYKLSISAIKGNNDLTVEEMKSD